MVGGVGVGFFVLKLHISLMLQLKISNPSDPFLTLNLTEH